MAVARLLHLAGYSVDLYLAGNPASFTEEMKIQCSSRKLSGIHSQQLPVF